MDASVGIHREPRPTTGDTRLIKFLDGTKAVQISGGVVNFSALGYGPGHEGGQAIIAVLLPDGNKISVGVETRGGRTYYISSNNVHAEDTSPKPITPGSEYTVRPLLGSGTRIERVVVASPSSVDPRWKVLNARRPEDNPFPGLKAAVDQIIAAEKRQVVTRTLVDQLRATKFTT